MKAWLFQDTRQKKKLGDKCPWSVGWNDAGGKKTSKKIGAKSTAEKFRKRIEAKLALGLCTDRTRVKWKDFRKQFAETILAAKATGTATEYSNALDCFERIAKPVYMDSITTATIDIFIAKRQREDAGTPIRKTPKAAKPPKLDPAKRRRVSPATVNKELRHIRAAVRKARKWGMLRETPDFSMLREPQRDPYFVDDATFKALYDACHSMTRPASRRYAPADWWRALLAFGFLTGWRISEILDLRRADLNMETGIAKVDAESTKGRREARVELHPVVVEHLQTIIGFSPSVFDWPNHRRTLWQDFKALKEAAGVTFPGAFHRLRFGFANANVDTLPADVLQTLMRHQSAQTTRGYINAAQRLKRSGVSTHLHVPACLLPNAATG